MRLLPLLFSLLAIPIACYAQQAPCGLTTMTETKPPIFPPIAKAAHVTGEVIMLATFKTNGEVEKVEVLSGPQMLRIAATTYVQGWRANEYTGPRTCPIVASFLLEEGTVSQPMTRSDLQHVSLHAQVVILSDPAVDIQKRKHFWLF